MNTNTPPCIHIIAHALFSSLIIKINKISSHFYIMHACVFLCIYLPPQAKLQALLSWRLIRIEEIPYHFYIMNAWMYNKYVYVCTHDAHTWVCVCVWVDAFIHDRILDSQQRLNCIQWEAHPFMKKLEFSIFIQVWKFKQNVYIRC